MMAMIGRRDVKDRYSLPDPPGDDGRPGAFEPGRSAMTFLIVALALVLAIGYFFLTSERRADRGSDAVTQMADDVDNGARAVGDAAAGSLDRLRKGE